MSTVKDRLESLTSGSGPGTYTLSETHSLTSIAISLKRIADFLDAVKAEDQARKSGGQHER